MNKPQRILIISGMTGVGKSRVAYEIAKRLQKKIIVGDALQIYKNWPIASNHPPQSYQEEISYLGLGQFDVNKQQLSVVDYRNLIVDYLQNLKEEQIVVEGGGCFYLDYLLRSKGETFTQKQLQESKEQVRSMLQQNSSTSILELLQQHCKHYDNSINPNDTYRLEKALCFALLSKGQQFKFDNFDGEGQCLRDKYDVRGIFMYSGTARLQIQNDVRCQEMMQRGFLNEYLDYTQSPHQTNVMPIGYDEARILIEKVTKKDKNMFSAVQNFVGQLSTRTRQYASYQRKYFRQKFEDFVWLDSRVVQKEDRIWDILTMPRNEYDELIKSTSNQKQQQHVYNSLENKTILTHPERMDLSGVVLQLKEKLKSI